MRVARGIVVFMFVGGGRGAGVEAAWVKER